MSQFWPPKITFNFLGKSWNNFEIWNVQYLLKYDTLQNMYMIQIYDIKNLSIFNHCKKRCMFLPLHSFRKQAIERHHKQDSYCDYKHISQIYITGRNINLVYKDASEFKNKRKILLLWHKPLKTVNCVISDVIFLEQATKVK